MKTKVIALLEMAVVLCSLFLMALPATVIATEQDDYVLGIYGNANEDDTIDMRDLTYEKLIFFGKKPETELADAKYDGKLNPLDFIQIKLIIVGKEKELTIVDEVRTVTVKKPIKKIVAAATCAAESLKTLKAADKVVAVSNGMTKGKYKVFFPEFTKLPGVADHYKLDYEKIYELNPDILVIYGPHKYPDPKYQVMIDMLEPMTKVLALGRSFSLREDLLKLGYILDKEEEAEEFSEWYDGQINTIKERVEKFSEEDKPRVYYEYYSDYKTFTKNTMRQTDIVNAGGINIAADLLGGYIEVDPEWLMVQNPDVIVRLAYGICSYDVDDPTEMTAVWESIMNRPELANTTAVKNKRVYVFCSDHSESARNFVGLAYWAKWYHPGLFEDVDPKAIHQEYLTKFQGLDYDLDKHGVFVYPPFED